MTAAVNVILLAAGRGSRLSELTAETHKSLLPIGGRPALGRILDEILSRPVEQVVVVTGSMAESVEGFVRSQGDPRVEVVFNERFADDTNILSVELGVSALRRPEAGYLIVETDLVIEPGGWSRILDLPATGSFWVTRGVYGPRLTGGALLTAPDGRVVEIVYAPDYSPRFDGWLKLVGVLYVGAAEVEADRRWRRAGISKTIRQYYMTPWVEHLGELACSARPIDGLLAVSFNDLEAYRMAKLAHAELARRKPHGGTKQS